MRRKAFINPLFRPGGQKPVRAQVIRAHTLFDNRQYLAAGQLFEQLAQAANARGGMRAPQFYFQAGRSFFHAGQADHGMILLKEGYQILYEQSRFMEIRFSSERLALEIRTLGFDEQAKQIENWTINLPEMSQTTNLPTNSKASLPLKCPSCGGPVHPDEVSWLDDQTAECAYCGSSLRVV